MKNIRQVTEHITLWQQQIEGITGEFKAKFDDLSPSELNRKPNAHTWSIAENIDHLITLNSTYFPILEQLQQGRYQVPLLGKLPFYVRFMGNTLLKSVDPERRKKIKTFAVWEPKNAAIAEDILQAFVAHQEDLKTAVAGAGDFIAAGTVIASPANKNIVYTLEKAFEIIIAHEKRHFNQATETMELVYRKQYNFDM